MIKELEDFLCDRMDALFADGIRCGKIMEQGRIGVRWACVSAGPNQVDDHGCIWRATGEVSEVVKSRSKAIEDVDKIRGAMPLYFTSSAFAIIIKWDYSVVPYKIMVGTVPAYIVKANLTIYNTKEI